ncbi:hypothetical protein [Bacillus cereus]
MKFQEFLVTFQLSRGKLQQVIREEIWSILRNKLKQDIADANIHYIEIDGTIIFTHHIKLFDIHRV